MTLDRAQQQRIHRLIQGHRWAALASVGQDGPECSWVAHAPEPGFQGFLLHLSDLASHTRNLLREPRASLAISEQERPDTDPQTLARLTLFGSVAQIARDDPAYPAAAARYQQRLPDAVPLFEFGDFRLLRFRPARVRFIGGFARAFSLDAAALTALADAVTDH